jgi:hypothetical protein
VAQMDEGRDSNDDDDIEMTAKHPREAFFGA